jgi:hypothetical protein
MMRTLLAGHVCASAGALSVTARTNNAMVLAIIRGGPRRENRSDEYYSRGGKFCKKTILPAVTATRFG